MASAAALSLPQDLLVKIVFLIPDWPSVTALLQALRPAYVLGPLESLWQLHFQLKWRVEHLWPRLDLTKLDAASCTHVEGIVKYYAQVTVNSKMDVAWFRQFGHPTTSIRWDGPIDALNEWKSFRITSLTNRLDYDQLVQAFQVLPYLEVFNRSNSNPRIAAIIFQFAASSSSLCHLELSNEFDLLRKNYCTITTNMAQDIIAWGRSCPVRVFQMRHFAWESPNLRDEVLRAVLNNPTLHVFNFCEEDDETLLTFEAVYDRSNRRLTLSYSGGYGSSNVEDDYLAGYLGLVRHLIATEIRELSLMLLDSVTFSKMWTAMTPLLQ
ncbi:hypothetical protein AeRB84_011902 [Aphanomyces euteiches]|nr:hypothetical protein AeRB84_011902 [Aphanomyces euteiches]